MPNEQRPSILDAIEVPSPCTVAWESMDPGDGKRFCHKCTKNVYNLSSMSKAEAEKLLARSTTKPCVAFYRNSDGSVKTDECPRLLRPLRDLVRCAAAVFATALLALCAAIPAFGKDVNRDESLHGSAPVASSLPPTALKSVESINEEPLILGNWSRRIPVRHPSYALQGKVVADDVAAGESNYWVHSSGRVMKGVLFSRLMDIQTLRHALTRLDTAFVDERFSVASIGEWRAWYDRVGTVVLDAWKKHATTEGQLSVGLQVDADGRMSCERMGAPYARAADEEKREDFRQSVDDLICDLRSKVVIPPPSIFGEKIEAVEFTATFGMDSEVFPRYDSRDFGVSVQYDEDKHLRVANADGKLSLPRKDDGDGYTISGQKGK